MALCEACKPASCVVTRMSARVIREEALGKHPDVYERDGRNVRIRPNQPGRKSY
jgi:hypothetical protein